MLWLLRQADACRRGITRHPRFVEISGATILLPISALQFCSSGSTKHLIWGGLTGGEDVLHHAGSAKDDFSHAWLLPHVVMVGGGSRNLAGELGISSEHATKRSACCMMEFRLSAGEPQERRRLRGIQVIPTPRKRTGAVQNTASCSLHACRPACRQ